MRTYIKFTWIHCYIDYNIQVWGIFIGNIECPATACADDVTLNSSNSDDTQTLIDIAYDFSKKQKYKLQPDKSVIIDANKKSSQIKYTMDNKEMQHVQSSTHLGIQRGSSTSETIMKTVEANIKKARRTTYSLLSAGLHGETGLDPHTSLHLVITYVLPILLYGLEIIIPSQKYLKHIELFQKKLLKQILSLPQNVADPAPYLLSGFLPIEEQLHIKILNFFK